MFSLTSIQPGIRHRVVSLRNGNKERRQRVGLSGIKSDTQPPDRLLSIRQKPGGNLTQFHRMIVVGGHPVEVTDSQVPSDKKNETSR